MDTPIYTILSNLVKPRDFLFTGIPMVFTFILESINETIIPVSESGTSAIVAGSIGFILNKSLVEFLLEYRRKKFAIKSAKNYIELLENDIENKELDLDALENNALKLQSLKSILKLYEKEVYTYKEFKKQLDNIKNNLLLGN